MVQSPVQVVAQYQLDCLQNDSIYNSNSQGANEMCMWLRSHRLMVRSTGGALGGDLCMKVYVSSINKGKKTLI